MGEGARRFMSAALRDAPVIDLATYTQGLVARHRLAREWSAFAGRGTLVLAPISTLPPFAPGSDTQAGFFEPFIRSLAYTLCANVLGLPAAAVPVGLDGGMPQAVQLIGPRHGDERCLDAAEIVEAASPRITPMEPRQSR